MADLEQMMPKRTGSPARASEKCRIAHGQIVWFISETVDQLDLRPILAGSNPPHYSRTITLGIRVAFFCDTDS